MLPLFSLVLLFVGQTLASPSANQYVENVIYGSLQNVIRSENLDSIHLNDFTFEYKDKTFFGNVKGKAEYTEGNLTGLSSVERLDDCSLDVVETSSKYITCMLTFTNLNTAYKGKVKYGKLPKVPISPKGQVKDVAMLVQIGKEFHSDTQQVMDVSVLGVSVEADFTGLGPLNKQMGILEDNYREHVESEITNVIDTRFRYALNKAVSTVPMPSV